MKGHIKVSVLSGCGIHDQHQELLFLARALALELPARDTGTPHHIQPRSEIGSEGLVFIDLRAECVLP